MYRVFSPFAAAIATAMQGMAPPPADDPRIFNLGLRTMRTGKHALGRRGFGYDERSHRGDKKERARLIHRSRVTLQQAAGLENRAISQACAKKKVNTNNARALEAMANERIAFCRRNGMEAMAKDIERRVSRAKLLLKGIV